MKKWKKKKIKKKKEKKEKKSLPWLQKYWSWRILLLVSVLPAYKAGALQFELIPQSISQFENL